MHKLCKLPWIEKLVIFGKVLFKIGGSGEDEKIACRLAKLVCLYSLFSFLHVGGR